MAMNKRKVTTAVVAGVTAVALLLGGTFAWTSISQTAKNEAIVDINPGGRLHDDFDGTNKDVYVENFSSGATGVNIFARIRLDQYFEVGQDAGINKDGTDRKVTQVLGTDINDESTWVTYLPTLDENGSIDFSQLQANDNWQWTLGNDDTNKPYYMPTFNMNKDSLAADINGTYEGTTEGDIVHYDDYLVYVDADGNPKTATGTEVYDWDDEDADEEETPVITTDDTTPRDSADVYHKEAQTHTAKQINYTATVMTMAEWIAAGSQIGPYWVYDTDGWAYWAQPIAPGETTGLLLDSISMSRVPDDNWYYGINVVGQFATASDIYQFDGMSAAAEELFGIVSEQEESVVITGADTIFPGESTTYSATRMALGTTAANQPTFAWNATDADGNAITDVTMDTTTGELTVGADVPLGTQITVTATASEAATLAEGETTALAGSKTVTVADEATVTADNGLTMYTVGGTTTETFTATVDGVTNGTFTWSVTDGNGNKPTDATITADATDSSKATLTVGANESAEKLIVTATFKPTEGTAVYVGTYEVKNSDITTTDDMAARAYALVVPNDDGEETYDIVFVRSADTVAAGKNTYNGKTIEEVNTCNETNSGDNEFAFYKMDKITNATFANKIAPISTSRWFTNFKALKSVNFNDKLDASNLTNMELMFASCESLESIDLSGLKFSDSVELNVKNTFASCSNLKEVKLPERITVTKLETLFEYCTNLETITGLNTWDVSNVKSFFAVFYKCESLAELDLSEWKTSAATDMERMFEGMKSLVTIDLSNFDLNGVDMTVYMFSENTALTTITGADKWDVSTVTVMYQMFYSCEKLQLDCSAWNVSCAYDTTFNQDAPGVILPTAWQTTE